MSLDVYTIDGDKVATLDEDGTLESQGSQHEAAVESVLSPQRETSVPEYDYEDGKHTVDVSLVGPGEDGYLKAVAANLPGGYEAEITDNGKEDKNVHRLGEKAAEKFYHEFFSDSDTQEKDWVSDPTPEAPNRWVDTESGEYRYQENKPDPSEGGDGDEQDDSDEAEDVEYVETPHGEVPDTDGPIPPDMRDEPIGSDTHPVLWKEPDGEEELEEYISEMQETEWYGEGSEIFKKAFDGPENTENYHTDEEGNWDEDRLEKHQEWAEELFNEDAATDEDEKPIGMILLGPPGAGKGWWQEQVEEGAYGETGEFVERDFTHISSDETKEPIPEYEETNASEVHDEASKIAKDNLAPEAIEREHNVIIDKVATSPGSTLDMVESMREQGYDVRANFVNVSTGKSAHNAVSRYFEEGRFTPLEFVDGAGADSRESFNEILDEADIPDEKVGRFDNEVPWGNAPDVEYLGEELLKALMGRLETFLSAPGEEQREEKDGRKARSGRDSGRNNGVHGRRFRGSSRGGHRERGRGTGRRDDRITLSDLVKEVEQIFLENVHEAPDDKVVHVDPDDDVEDRMYYVAEKAAEVVNEDF